MNPSVNMFPRPVHYPQNFIQKVSKALPEDSALIEDLVVGAKFCVGYVLKEKSPALYREWQTIIGVAPDPLPKETKPVEPGHQLEDVKIIRLTKDTRVFRREGIFLRLCGGLKANSLVGIGKKEWANCEGVDTWALPFERNGQIQYFLEKDLKYVLPKLKKT